MLIRLIHTSRPITGNVNIGCSEIKSQVTPAWTLFTKRINLPLHEYFSFSETIQEAQCTCKITGIMCKSKHPEHFCQIDIFQ